MTLVVPLDGGWKFRRLLPARDSAARVVDLPHSPFAADLDGRDHWFGECEYERQIVRPATAPTGPITLHVGAAMHTAVVLVDGVECGRHEGGYLPFEVDLTKALSDGVPHTLSIRVDNRDNPDVPPGKPYSEIDFCWYGGLYRQVELRCHPRVHITDPVSAGAVSGGGIFVRTLSLGADSATLDIRTHVRNTGPANEVLGIHVEIRDDERTVAQARHANQIVKSGCSETISFQIEVSQALLWQPDAPNLHQAIVTVRDANDQVVDIARTRFGIRRIDFSRSAGFVINGRPCRPRGTNRHQEHPRVGYAVPASADRRDARRIKEAGFDYVRLSHYPQSPDFLDACDELGILVMNCIPGWQFLGGDAFRAACYQNARDLIRRDRNHPCVVLWELCLNETRLDEAFMARLREIGHEEYPGDQMFTCGWLDRFDVYIRSRQHGELHTWKNGDKALVVAEYGDWEFYAATEGFDQKTGRGLYDPVHSSRQFRADGERGLRQQAANHQVALNDTLGSPAALDGLWSMFDYARGYDHRRAACGIMDIFRLPKFSYHFFRSQRHAGEEVRGCGGGPVVFVASHWTPTSDLTIPVFTNCDEVELRLNGTLLASASPRRDPTNAFLPHPPCVFHVPAFSAGTLQAIGYLAGEPAATHQIVTPETPLQLKIVIDDHGVIAQPGATDVLIVHARVIDRNGTLCLTETPDIKFSVEGSATIVGPAVINAEAGIASAVLSLPPSGTIEKTFMLRAEGTIAGAVLTGVCTWPPTKEPGIANSAWKNTAPAIG